MIKSFDELCKMRYIRNIRATEFSNGVTMVTVVCKTREKGWACFTRVDKPLYVNGEYVEINDSDIFHDEIMDQKYYVLDFRYARNCHDNEVEKYSDENETGTSATSCCGNGYSLPT